MYIKYTYVYMYISVYKFYMYIIYLGTNIPSYPELTLGVGFTAVYSRMMSPNWSAKFYPVLMMIESTNVVIYIQCVYVT